MVQAPGVEGWQKTGGREGLTRVRRAKKREEEYNIPGARTRATSQVGPANQPHGAIDAWGVYAFAGYDWMEVEVCGALRIWSALGVLGGACPWGGAA